MVVAKWQTFKAKSLSSRIVGTQWPKHATLIYKERTWLDPSGGKSSLENTIHVALSAIKMCMRPSRVVEVSILVWLRALTNASLCVLDEAKRLYMDMRAHVVRNWRKISSSCLWSSSLVATPANGLSMGRGWVTLPLRETIWTSLWVSPYPSGNIVKCVMGGTCCKYLGNAEGCLGIPSGVNPNGLGIC